MQHEVIAVGLAGVTHTLCPHPLGAPLNQAVGQERGNCSDSTVQLSFERSSR
jgi:hypothetical protein